MVRRNQNGFKIFGKSTTKVMLILCYHTADEKLIEVANRYWAVDENGKYLESSTSLLPLTGAKYASQQTEILSNIATAFVVNIRCLHCNKPQKIKSRSSYIEKRNFDCEECFKLRQEHQKKIEDERSRSESMKLEELLKKSIETNKGLTADYQSISDDLAILVLALNRSLGDRLFEIRFNAKHCANFTPASSGNYISRLLRAGLIVTNPEYSAVGAFFIKNDQLWHYRDLVVYEAVPDKIIESGQNIIDILQNRPFLQGEVLKSLWIDYATSECMSYALDLSSQYGFEIEEDESNKIESIIRVALSTYSISNLWSMIWMVVKDAAALSTREYYNKKKAAATLPGKLNRHLEDVSKEKRSLRSWERPSGQSCSALGEIFYEIWMFDEHTPGTEVANIFQTSKRYTEINELYVNRQSVTEKICEILNQDLGPEMLAIFADSIREGKSLMEALEISYFSLSN